MFQKIMNENSAFFESVKNNVSKQRS